MSIMVVMKGQADLLEIVLTLSASGSFSCLLNGRQQQSNQDCYDGDHDKQFNQRESSNSVSSHLAAFINNNERG